MKGQAVYIALISYTVERAMLRYDIISLLLKIAEELYFSAAIDFRV